MYARVVFAQVKPGTVEEAIGIYQAIEPQWKQQPGFVGAYSLTNSDDETKAISISIWETQADLKATEASGWYQEQLAKFADILAAPPNQELHEVTVRV